MTFRALAASRAFQGGVSVEQIMTACHWKSHNTFTNFYLKDLAMADREYLYLGPVVAAQQSLQQSSSAGFYVTPSILNSLLEREGGGGGGHVYLTPSSM